MLISDRLEILEYIIEGSSVYIVVYKKRKWLITIKLNIAHNNSDI